uniref:Uncharacterized protein n=1 Tax=Varanus komodoensis TaxID=61221 RepID=A0A8D2LD82_VARKO
PLRLLCPPQYFNSGKLHVNQTDNYFCKIELLDPAPYETSTSHRGTLIHVQGKSRKMVSCGSLHTHPHPLGLR